MKKWFKKIGQSFLRTDEAKDKEAISAVKQKEIKDKEAIPAVELEDTTKTQKNEKSWFNKLGDNFKRTSSNIRKAIFIKRLDEKSLEEIEEAFLMSDLGVNNTNLLIDELKNKKINTKNDTNENVSEFLEKQFSNINHELDLKPNKELRVILVFGVNGSGKTTLFKAIIGSIPIKSGSVVIKQNLKILVLSVH